MSDYTPRDGDDITVSNRGTVYQVDENRWQLHPADSNKFRNPWYFTDFSVWNVEVHAQALPTTLGSVVRCVDRNYYLFLTRGGWTTQDGYRTLTGDLSGCSTQHEVIFDAGAS